MRASTLITASIAAITLTACATPQENPHYRHSSKANMPQTVQYADSSTSDVAPVVYRQAAPSEAQTHSASYPQPSPQAAPLTYQPEAAPIASSEMIETGGQNAGEWGQAMQDTAAADPAPVYTPPAVTAPATAAPQIMAPQAQPQMIAQPQMGNGTDYLVQEEDTVYSLSRARCVSVAEVQQLNGLDANFTIRAGGFIKLPASRC